MKLNFHFFLSDVLLCNMYRNLLSDVEKMSNQNTRSKSSDLKGGFCLKTLNLNPPLVGEGYTI